MIGVTVDDIELADLSAEAAVAYIRAELVDLQTAGQLGPNEVQWAMEQLVSSGVSLPDVLSVVFDFAEVEWLTEVDADLAPPEFDPGLLAELARQLGLDPHTGKRAGAPAPVPRAVIGACSPIARVDASTPGSEGVRQRPLRGWQGD